MIIENAIQPVLRPAIYGPLSDPAGGSTIPANAIKQRNGAYILDRAGNYIELRS